MSKAGKTPTELIARLELEGARLAAWLGGCSPGEVAWKPSEESWSILEVVGHLTDEERGDFRPRLRMLLESEGPWPPIDPEGWARSGDWQTRSMQSALAEFTSERQASLEWLRGLREPDWSLTYDHPEVGTISAHDLLATWAAHDLLHVRQIARLQASAFQHAVAPLSTRYADPTAPNG